MKKYQKNNHRYFLGALASILIGTLFGTVLQFFKGEVLDHAAAGEIQETISCAVLLFAFILCEVLFYFLYDLFSAKFVVGCTKELKHDLFASIVSRTYVAYKECPQGEYIAKYSNEADTIQERHFRMLPTLWEILLSIINRTVLVVSHQFTESKLHRFDQVIDLESQ